MATTNSSHKTRFDKLNTCFASNVSTIKHLMLPRRSHMQSGVVHLTDPSQNLAPLQQQTMSHPQATDNVTLPGNITPTGNRQRHPSRQQTMSPLQATDVTPPATDNVTPPGNRRHPSSNRQCHPSRQQTSPLQQQTSPLQATDNVTPPGNRQRHPSRQQTTSPLQATDVIGVNICSWKCGKVPIKSGKTAILVCYSCSQWTDAQEIIKVRSYIYIVRYPVLGTVQSALHFTPWQTCSFQLHLNFSGKHSAMLQLLQISTSVCSQVLIYTAEWTVAMWDERNCQSFETAARGFEPRFSRSRARRSNHYATASQSLKTTKIKHGQNK